MRKRGLCCHSLYPSVRPSVCLSVTFVYCIQTAELAEDIVKLNSFSLGSPIILVFWLRAGGGVYILGSATPPIPREQSYSAPQFCGKYTFLCRNFSIIMSYCQIFFRHTSQKILIYNTRSKNEPHFQLFTTSLGQRSIKFKGCQLWCSLPDELRSVSSTSVFKTKLKQFLQTL